MDQKPGNSSPDALTDVDPASIDDIRRRTLAELEALRESCSWIRSPAFKRDPRRLLTFTATYTPLTTETRAGLAGWHLVRTSPEPKALTARDVLDYEKLVAECIRSSLANTESEIRDYTFRNLLFRNASHLTPVQALERSEYWISRLIHELREVLDNDG